MLKWISGLFGVAAQARVGLYRRGILARHRLPSPVISVGNLAVGGTGKTPLVALLARMLQQEGFEPAVLSRGYKGRAERSGLLVSDGQRVLCKLRQCGDEPFLLARQLQGIPLAVGRNRRRSASLIPPAQDLQKRIFILDDAFQHLRIRRDLDLLVLDATDPFAGGRPMPSGRLREPLSAISRADWILLTRSHLAGNLDETQEKVRRLHSEAPLFSFHHAPTALIDVRSGRPQPFEELAGRAGIALAGIGKPHLFVRDLQQLGIRVQQEAFFPDHHWFTQQELDRLLNRTQAIFTTEKDAVRLEGLRFDEGQVLALRIEARPDAPEEFRRRLVEWAKEVSRQDAKAQSPE
ncbi:MAG: tetraacyldisaccharide 4'-kinase [Acidobacteriota bacterium]